MAPPTFCIASLGCKVNQYEAQFIREQLKSLGFLEKDVSLAEYVVINSCTVTATADRKTRQIIRKIKRNNPCAKIFITGCLISIPEDAEKIRAMSEVCSIVPMERKKEIPSILASLEGVSSSGVQKKETVEHFDSHTRAFLKIQDGCPQRCSYCKVSIVRGKPWSKPVDNVVREFESLLCNGYKEIVLTGICLGAWQDKGFSLKDLVRVIQGVKGDFRVRLSSIEPNHISDGLIFALAESKKFCEHLHISLQSGSDDVLKSMNRPYSVEYFLNRIKKIRTHLGNPGLSLDIIVGYPTETDEDFKKSLRVIEDICPSRLHVFQFSKRKGTAAYKMPMCSSHKQIKARSKKMIYLGREKQLDFTRSFIGKELEVIFEDSFSEGYSQGYSRRYVRVKAKTREDVVGKKVIVRPTSFDEDDPSLVEE